MSIIPLSQFCKKCNSKIRKISTDIQGVAPKKGHLFCNMIQHYLYVSKNSETGIKSQIPLKYFKGLISKFLLNANFVLQMSCVWSFPKCACNLQLKTVILCLHLYLFLSLLKIILPLNFDRLKKMMISETKLRLLINIFWIFAK